jgi:hypothetical protein
MNSSPTPPTDPGSKPAEVDFMSLFCEQQQCAPPEFEERAFRMCLYWRARVVAPVIRKIMPRYFEPDFALIRYLAKCQGRRNALNELAAFTEANGATGGFARRVLRNRISARKASKLITQIFGRQAESTPMEPGRGE